MPENRNILPDEKMGMKLRENISSTHTHTHTTSSTLLRLVNIFTQLSIHNSLYTTPLCTFFFFITSTRSSKSQATHYVEQTPLYTTPLCTFFFFISSTRSSKSQTTHYVEQTETPLYTTPLCTFFFFISCTRSSKSQALCSPIYLMAACDWNFSTRSLKRHPASCQNNTLINFDGVR